MAGLNVASRAEGRELNRELPLVPFIDFLLCLVAFLLVTAVWSSMARMDADARVPGPEFGEPPVLKRLHVEVRGESFRLVWRQGSTVVESVDVPRRATRSPAGDERFPDLGKAIAEQWKTLGVHKDARDPKADEAVVHAGDAVEYGEVVGVLDAIASAERQVDVAGGRATVPAFHVSFAVD